MKNNMEYTLIREEEIKGFSEVAPGKDAFVIDLSNAYRSSSQKISLKSPKTGKESFVSNNGRSKIAVFGVDKVWANKLNAMVKNVTKNTNGNVCYIEQIDTIVKYVENNCKGFNVRALKEDESVAETNKEQNISLLVDTRKNSVKKAAFILPFSAVVLKGGEYKQIGEEGAYFIKGDDKTSSEILSSDEFDCKFVSKDTRYTRRNLIKDVFNWDDLKRKQRGYVAPNPSCAKVSTYSTHEISHKLAKHYFEKYPDAFVAHKEGLIVKSDGSDKGFQSFIEDMGSLPERLVGRNSTFTISKNAMHMKGRFSIGKWLMEQAESKNHVSAEEKINFNEDTYFHERQGSQGRQSNAPSAHLPWRDQENKPLPKEQIYEQMSIFDIVGKSGNIR